MTEVLLTRPFREEDLARFSDFDTCHFTFSLKPTAEELENAEAILGMAFPDELALAKKLRWLQLPSAGADFYMGKKDAFPEGAVLTNLSGAFGQSISEFALVMTLMLMKNMQLYRDNQNAALWRDEGMQDSPVGKDLLILGAGNIGGEVARLFKVFGCRITGMRRNPRVLPENFDEMITIAGLDEALPKADIIISALPNTPETSGLINKKRLSLMKKTAVLVNVGRGSLIDTDALYEALSSGALRGAALDVTDPEPLPADHPLWHCPNAIITPHISGGTFGHLQATEEALFNICRTNLARLLAGEPLLNEVDFATGYRKLEGRY